jgi:superfamily II RNA helicase
VTQDTRKGSNDPVSSDDPAHPSHLFSFELDDFQLEAIKHLQDGKSVVVCAPTGAGKTVIAEYAVEMALMQNKRCFYTTPLKALSNQKLYDFKQKFGDDKVGLLTGDISINRDAAIVVMTTEVFRNMLYGTILGEVGKNLRDVAYVVLDECHYMNDSERGTVWEESIIYAPTDVQLVALSATVANADELTTWIDETHGATELVVSDFRPVPLRFHYFGDQRIYPLLNPGGGVNNLLKNRFGKRKKPDRFQKRRPGGQNIGTHPADVLSVLSARNMLPAIYFLFSRRGCEESMKRARGIPLINDDEAQQLRQAIDEFALANPNLKNHPHIPYLFEGVAVHHAGMLPSWKGMVEKLFQKGLLKAVFATETLAAGINMPARSTVISSLTKRADEGHRSLTASEFLQMSGRAGRRGMDEVGHVVVLHNTFESCEDAAKLATAFADPLSSRFTPSYGMVLNLLERHSIDDARDLIERSFGQFKTNHELEPLYEARMRLEKELETLRGPLCPGEIGDLNLYAKRLDAIRFKHKQLKYMEKGLRPQKKVSKGKGGPITTEIVTTPEGEQALDAQRGEISELLREAYAMPCHGCPVQKPCSKQTSRTEQIERRIKEISRRLEKETGKYWRTFEALTNVLRLQGYLDGDKPSKLGHMAACIRGTNELFLTEVAINGLFDHLRPWELASVLTALVQEEGRGGQDLMRIRLSPAVDSTLEEVGKLARKIKRLQKDFDIDIAVEFSPHFSALTEMWAQGASWAQIRHASSFDEGDVVRALRRTLDLCRQYIRADGMAEHVVNLCRDVEVLINRDEVKEVF